MLLTREEQDFMLYFVCHFYFTLSLQGGCWYLLISFIDKDTLNSDFMHNFTILIFLTKCCIHWNSCRRVPVNLEFFLLWYPSSVTVMKNWCDQPCSVSHLLPGFGKGRLLVWGQGVTHHIRHWGSHWCLRFCPSNGKRTQGQLCLSCVPCKALQETFCLWPQIT